MTTCFCTIVDEAHKSQADKLIASAKYFHSDIEMQVFSPPVEYAISKSYAIDGLLHSFDRVICFDADSIIVAPLTELLAATEYDIVGVRNNNDYGNAGCDEPITQYGCDIADYMNGGLISVTNREFIKEWMRDDNRYAHLLPFGSQTVFNALADDYKTHIIDGWGTPYHYGVSGLYGTHTHWDSWKDIYIDGDKLMLGEKQVKVLHHAGGAVENKLDFNLFHHSVQKRLREICNM